MSAPYRYRPCPDCGEPELPDVLEARGCCDACDARRDTLPAPPPTEPTPPLTLAELAAIGEPDWSDREAITAVDCPRPPGAPRAR